MANRVLVAGQDTFILYGVETTYGTAVAVTKILGIKSNFKGNSTNNLVDVEGFVGTTTGGRETVQFVPGKFESTLSTEFKVVSWDFLEDVFGGRTGAGTGASPYVYTQEATLPSLTIGEESDNDTTDREVLHLGCKSNTITIRCSVGEPVIVSVDFLSGNLDKDTTLPSNIALPSGDIYNFAGGTIELPDGSALPNIIDSVDITINQNAEILYGLGSRFGQAGILKALKYTVSYTLKYIDETVIDLFLGSATGPTNPTANASMAIKFTNGANKFVDFKFGETKIGEFNTSHDVNEALTEDVTCNPITLTIDEQQTA